MELECTGASWVSRKDLVSIIRPLIVSTHLLLLLLLLLRPCPGFIPFLHNDSIYSIAWYRSLLWPDQTWEYTTPFSDCNGKRTIVTEPETQTSQHHGPASQQGKAYPPAPNNEYNTLHTCNSRRRFTVLHKIKDNPQDSCWWLVDTWSLSTCTSVISGSEILKRGHILIWFICSQALSTAQFAICCYCKPIPSFIQAFVDDRIQMTR